jgi:hypothetical protein
MRNYQLFSRLKCKYLYGDMQDHALAISPAIQQEFTDDDGVYTPSFVGGCWYEKRFPGALFPSYLEKN